tara:strand:- start:228 stop:488 length:261 start_codon:yes stop_codon:yes gene_type:complete
MSESILVLTGIITGTAFSLAGVGLGAYLMKRAYEHITNPHQIALTLNKSDDESRGLDGDVSFDWDSYDQYVSRAEDDDDDGGVPEA